ncbi:uncharacterized membrane protein YjjP (DUF1212 family) [Rhodococcus sp. LBL1]|nr:uncharacterized membrane protein YjjP (DUF1212 family) [Rhodococcus sp. LBL1]MDH6685247.1 uncharacterized membrane protein YjjP (DUF1212 family) [Rhodococcus sp. LBL2]
MSAYPPGPPAAAPAVDAKRLWSGGVATALVAALAAVVGLLVVRGLLDIEVITPDTTFGESQVTTIAGYAIIAALLATALLHLLMISTPRATSFFGWIGILATVAVTLWPYTVYATTDSKIGSSLIYLVVGIAIVTLLSGVAGTARTTRPVSP